MGWPTPVLFYNRFGGQNDQEEETIRQDQSLLEMNVAQNAILDPMGKYKTREGFTHVRASAPSGAPAFTGIKHFGDLTDKVVLIGSDGKVYQDSANPPAEITGGTAHTTGNTVLPRIDVGGAAGSEIAVIVTSSRDVPRKVTLSSMALADLGGTPARGRDFHVWGRRPWMFSPTDGTTVRSSFASFGDVDDNLESWNNPYAINFLNFGRPGQRVNILGAEKYLDHLMAFSEDSVFPIYQTPNALLPFAFQDDILNEEQGGPVTIQSVVPGNGRLYWISRNFDVKMMTGQVVESIGYAVQPFLRGLSDSRRVAIVGGFEPKYRMVLWAVSDGSDSTNQDVLAYHVDSPRLIGAHAFTFHTLSICSFGHRVVSGEPRLLGGHYNGLFSNLFDGSTTGDLQAAASAIDADLQTAPMHLGLPGVFKKVSYVAVEFPPVGSEAVTVQYDLDGSGSFTSFTESTFSPTAANPIGYFTIPAPFETIVLRFRDATSGQVYRVNRIGFPRPLATYASRP